MSDKHHKHAQLRQRRHDRPAIWDAAQNIGIVKISAQLVVMDEWQTSQTRTMLTATSWQTSSLGDAPKYRLYPNHLKSEQSVFYTYLYRHKFTMYAVTHMFVAFRFNIYDRMYVYL